MSIMKWNERYSVGINQIDNQHKKLIDMINVLSDCMKSGKTNENVGKVFLELINYTDVHFKTEEKLFQDHNYGAMLKHVKEHNALREKAFDLKQKYEAGSFVISVELLNFLVSWVNNHILEEDKQYSAYLISKGVR